MHHFSDKGKQNPVCNFIPSYSSYNGVGGSFATGLSYLVELILSLGGVFRR